MVKGFIDREEIRSMAFEYDEEDDRFTLTIQMHEEYLKKFGDRLGKKLEKDTIDSLVFSKLKFSSSDIVMFD